MSRDTGGGEESRRVVNHNKIPDTRRPVERTTVTPDGSAGKSGKSLLAPGETRKVVVPRGDDNRTGTLNVSSVRRPALARLTRIGGDERRRKNIQKHPKSARRTLPRAPSTTVETSRRREFRTTRVKMRLISKYFSCYRRPLCTIKLTVRIVSRYSGELTPSAV